MDLKISFLILSRTSDLHMILAHDVDRGIEQELTVNPMMTREEPNL